MTEPTTTPPPSPEARALRTLGRELDTLGDVAIATLVKAEALEEMGEADARTLAQVKGAVERVETKLDYLIELLTNPERGVLPRLERIELWRGYHEREHVAAE